MKRKFGIVQALMGRAPVIVLDEPTSGLDPLMIEAFAETVHELKAEGSTTIFLSSHVLSEVERLCDRVGIIRRGTLVRQTSIADLRQETPRRVRIFFEGPAPEPPPALAAALTRRGPRRWDLEWRGPLGPRARRDARARSGGHRDRAVQARGVRAGDLRRRQRAATLRMLAALVGRSLRRHLGLVAGLAVVLSAFQVLLVLIARNLQREGLFSQLSALVPPVFLEAFGGSIIASFSGLSAFGFFHPVVVLTLCCGAIYLASELAGDVDEGLVDLIAARPVPRRLIVTRSAVVSGGVTAVIVVLMFLTNRVALAWLAPAGSQAPPTSAMLWVAANLLAVVVVFRGGGARAGRVRPAARDSRRRDRARLRSSCISCTSPRHRGRRRAPSRSPRRSTTTKACAR